MAWPFKRKPITFNWKIKRVRNGYGVLLDGKKVGFSKSLTGAKRVRTKLINEVNQEIWKKNPSMKVYADESLLPKKKKK